MLRADRFKDSRSGEHQFGIVAYDYVACGAFDVTGMVGSRDVQLPGWIGQAR